jgi:excisionase family DNA binding protein
MDITVTNLTIDDISKAIRNEIRNELRSFFNEKEEKEREDEIGGIELALELTGLAKPTIYSLVSTRKIPHSKRGKKLYFSRKELLEWLTTGKRKTKDEIAIEAANFDLKRKEAIPPTKDRNRFQKSKRQS